MLHLKNVSRNLLSICHSSLKDSLNLSTTATNRIKEIVATKEDKKLVIEGKYKEFEGSQRVLKSAVECKDACSVCSTNLDIKHTDVLILSQFLRSDGCMLPRRITGLCKTQQRRVATMVAMAQKAGLLADITPLNSKKDPKRRPQYKKFNQYFDESTIRLPLEYRRSTPNYIKLV